MLMYTIMALYVYASIYQCDLESLLVYAIVAMKLASVIIGLLCI